LHFPDTSDARHLFVSLPAIWKSSFVKSTLSLRIPFKTEQSPVFLQTYGKSLCSLDTNIYSHSMACICIHIYIYLVVSCNYYYFF
jgi:hypothetical protein